MKTAISIPDRLFKQAERLARRLGISRSELYALAVSALVKAEDRGDITARINAALGPHGEGSELVDLREVTQRMLTRSEWDEAK